MKKFVMIISLMMAFSMMVATTVMADTVKSIIAGEYVKLIGYNTSDSAGIMTYEVATKPDYNYEIGTYSTFCIQDNVYIYYDFSNNYKNNNDWYLVKSITTTVGSNNKSSIGTGTLNTEVAYLFSRYKAGLYNSQMNTLAAQTDFQDMLWYLQNKEIASFTPGNYLWDSDYKSYTGTGISLLGTGTEVLNLTSLDGKTDVQNQLYHAVPEPATMLLLGLGLVGLAGARRKFRN